MKSPTPGGEKIYIYLLLFILLITIVLLVVSYSYHLFYKKNKMLQVEKLKKDLKWANDRYSILLRNMSSEVRNNMIAVMGMSELILRESSDSRIRDNTGFIRSSGADILAILSGTIEISKIEEGIFEIIREEFDLENLLVDTVSIAGPLLKNKEIGFDIDVNKEIPKYLTGDYVKIRNCILYLLSFTRKNTDKGRIHLSFDYKALKDERISLDVEIITGNIYLDPSDLKHLLLSDIRTNKEFVSRNENDCIELLLAGFILKAIGASVSIDKNEEDKFVISVSIPLSANKSDKIGELRLLSSNRSVNVEYEGKFRAHDAYVLYADNNRTAVSLIKRFISKSGVNIDAAYNAEEVLSLIKSREYDVIFVDETMKDKNGIDIIKKIRSGTVNIINEYKPCIGITSDPSKKNMDFTRESKFDAYLSKPVNPGRFEDILIKYLPDNKVEIIEKNMIYPGIVSTDDIRKYSEGYDELYQNAVNLFKRANSYR